MLLFIFIFCLLFHFVSLKAQFKVLKHVIKHIKRHFQSLKFVKFGPPRTFWTLLRPFCQFLLHLQPSRWFEFDMPGLNGSFGIQGLEYLRKHPKSEGILHVTLDDHN